jgi:hypothetical protein
MRSLVEAEKRGEVCAVGESSRDPCETSVDFPDNCLDREDKIIADDSQYSIEKFAASVLKTVCIRLLLQAN